ncbi:hypothetical protein DSECCO2_452510 [anaerobic digester metagenome]
MNKLLHLIFVFVLCFDAQAQLISYEDRIYIPCPQANQYKVSIYNRIPALYPDETGSFYYAGNPKTWLGRKLLSEHLIILDTNIYTITIDPVVDFRVGREDGRSNYKNTRGYILNGLIGDKLSVRSEFYETQTTLPEYAAAWVDTMKFIPGMIRMKPFGTNGFDYGVVFSQIMWQPLKNYGMRLGYDRFHIGNGYRSMILSDASQAYPFLMNTFTHKKWTLSHNIASLHNPDFNSRLNVPLSESGVYQQKWFSFTYLTYSPKSWLNLGLFESVIFMPADSTGISFYPMSMMPVPLVRTITTEAKGLHHAMIGLQADATWRKFFNFYSQIVVDELYLSKLKYQQGVQGALQVGARLNIPDVGYVFGEFNLASNNAYTSSSAWNAYTQNDQPLAHPTGQQFKEFVAGARYQYNRFFADAAVNFIYAGALPITDNYLRSDTYTDVLLTGFYEPISRPDKAMHLGCSFSYIINSVTNLVVFAGMHYRDFHSTLSVTPENSLTYEFGIRHMIRKQYYDFF